jgi:catalase (peroxidase I)
VTPPGYGTTAILTAADVATISADITASFGLTNHYGVTCNPCTVGDNIGAMVRLAFHDIIGGGGPNGLGGGNGCNDPAHGVLGLESVLATYDVLAARYASKISVADLWILGATVAIRHASTTGAGAQTGGAARPPASPGPLNLPFRYGRRDDATCANLDTPFLATINAGMSWTSLFAVMGHRLGMTVQEAVAIMGAHALGRCEFANSGFEGGWSTFQSSMTNLYYSTMGNIGWNQPDLTKPEWIANNNAIMIGVDMVPLFTNAQTRGCPRFNSFTSCPQNTAEGNGEPAASIIRYAGSMTSWYAAYTTAWAKMAELNYAGALALPGQAVAGTTPTPTPTPTPTAAARSSSATTRAVSTAVVRSASTGVVRAASSTGVAASTRRSSTGRAGRDGGGGGGGRDGGGRSDRVGLETDSSGADDTAAQQALSAATPLTASLLAAFLLALGASLLLLA